MLLDQYNPKSAIINRMHFPQSVSIRGSTKLCRIAPRTASCHSPLASHGPNGISYLLIAVNARTIKTPLARIANHVIQSPGVWFLGPDSMGQGVAVILIPGDL